MSDWRRQCGQEEEIQTTHVFACIPLRAWDWQATREGYEPGDLIGWGATEQEAIENLIEQESNRG